MRRRSFLAGAGALALAPFAHAGIRYPAVRAGYRLEFPRDHGAHPEFRQEWWYVTGWLSGRRGEPLGFQVTFFRARPDAESANPSELAPRQVILAHAALSDPRSGSLKHDQRAGRAALGLAGAEQATTRTWVDDWRLELEGNVYRATIAAREFALDLAFEAKEPPLLQGEQGFSRKGAGAGEASYYYSRPQLAVSGTVENAGNREKVTGTAWLDHEWSSQYMSAGASGWDWVGLNLTNKEAVMAFRMRDQRGGTLFAPAGVRFEPLRSWRSPRTGVEYPVSMRISAAGKSYVLEPLMDDQELDARASTGTIYWEGAVRALVDGREAGKGYLELTGYWKPMKL